MISVSKITENQPPSSETSKIRGLRKEEENREG
jgi:hypothetical protein